MDMLGVSKYLADRLTLGVNGMSDDRMGGETRALC